MSREKSMKIRCRKIWIAALVGALGLVISLPLTRPPHNVTRAAFSRVKIGMNEADIESLFGVPSGGYSNGAVIMGQVPEWGRLDFPNKDVALSQKIVKQWITNWSIVAVGFDDEGRVTNAKFRYVSPEGLVVFSRLRHYLGIE